MSAVRKDTRNKAQLLAENEELRRRLEECEQTLEAIRTGEVDALVVSNSHGEQIYSLTGAEHAYRVIVETMNEAALTVDPDGTILFCNRRFCDLMRTPMHEVLGRRIAEFASELQQPALQEAMTQAQANPISRHLALRAADGTTVPVLLSGSLLHDGDQASLCLVASDLTELEESANSGRVLREQRQALEASEERYRRFFLDDLTGDFIATPEGKVVECNPAFAEIYGFEDPAQAIGYDLSQFNPGDWAEVVALVRRRGQLRRYESKQHYPEGKEIWVVANFVGQFNEDGELTGLQGYVFDDTQRKIAEVALEAANDRLRAHADNLAAANEQLLTQREELLRQTLELEEMKDAAERMTDQMEWLARIPAESPDPVLRIAADGTILYRNEAGLDLCRRWRADVGSPVPPAVQEMVHTVRAGGLPLRHEMSFGRRIWRFTAAPVPEADYVNLFAHDITIRRKAEQALRESEQRLKMAQKAAHIGVFDCDLVRDQSIWTEEFCEIFGFKPEDRVHSSKAWLQVMPAEEQARVEAEFSAAAAQRRPELTTEYPIARPDGATAWVVSTASLTYDAKGKPIRVLGVAQDITERKEAEIALKIKDYALASSLNAIAMADLQGRVTYANAAFLKLWGYPDEREILGRPVPDFWAEPERAREVVESIRDGGTWAGELTAVRKDGAHPILYLAASTVFDEAGVPLCSMAFFVDVTKRRQAEQALRESEERLRFVLEVSHIGAWQIDLESGTAVRSLEHARIFGYADAQSDWTYEKFLAHVLPEDRATVDAKQHEALTTQGGLNYECRIRRVDGETRWIWVAGRPRIGPTGRACCMAGIVQDVTERKTVELALQESKERFRTMADGLPLMIWVTDVEGSVSLVNRAYREFFGVTAEQMRGSYWRSLVHPDDAAAYADEFFACLRERRPFLASTRVRRADGQWRWVESYGTPRFSSDGEFLGFVGSSRDVTERKQSEEELRESEKRLASDLDAMTRLHKVGTLFIHEGNLGPVLDEMVDTAIAISGADFGNIQLLDRATSSLKIVAQHGFPPWYLDFWNSVSEGKSACGTALQRSERVIVEDVEQSPIFAGTPALEIQLRAGVRAVQSTPLVSRSGRPLGVFSTHYKRPHRPDERALRLFDLLARQASDIIERAQNEETLREMNATLESRVVQRTVELRHRAQQLQKLALELSQTEDRERRRLADILHDDLQQQLAAVKFHLGILSNRVREDARVQSTAVVLDGMLKNAIETSRNLSHELSPAVMYHGDMGEIFEWLAHQIQTKHGMIVHVQTRGPIDVESDALKVFLFKAVQEMLFNAVKHARVNETWVRVRRRGHCVGLCVSDRGRGFDPQELKQTAGFGLMSIRERIGLLGGRMRIHSVPGVGSRFIITVPDGQTADQSVGATLRGRLLEDRTADESPALEEGGHAGPPLRVLIADDHEVVRHGLAALLTEAGDVELVGEAGNGREAVDMAYRLQPDVVIMDVAMPLINGDEATRQIRKHLPQTRVVALSMYDEPGAIERMSKAGAESYILKTAPAETLLAAVRGNR